MTQRLALHPLPFIALIRRELLRGIRTVRMFLALVLLVMIGTFGVMGMWPRENLPLTMISYESEQLMGWLGALMLGAACVLIPGYAGGAILEERNLDTFDLLRTSLIRPAGILVGKFFNVIGLFALLMFAAMPLMATTYFLVGLNIEIMIVVIIVLVFVMVTCTSIGLSCSAVQRSAIRAIIHSYIWSAFALGGYLIFAFLCAISYQMYVHPDNMNEREIEAFVEWCMQGSPFYLLYRVTGAGVRVSEVIVVFVVQSCICLVALMLAWWRLCHPRDTSVPTDKPLISLWGARKKPDVRKYSYPPMPTYRNPVFLREYRHTGMFRDLRRWRRVVVAILAGFANVFLVYVLYIWKERPKSTSDFQDVVYIWSVMVGMFILFSAPAVQSVAFVREDEQDTKDLLAMSLLAPMDIAAGKMRAGFVQILHLFAFAYLCSLPVFGMVALSEHGWLVAFWSAVWTLLCATASLALGASASMLVRRTSLAVPLSYGLSVAYFALPSFGLLILNEMLHNPWPPRSMESISIVLSPIACGFQFVGRIMGRGWEWSNDPFLESSYLLSTHILAVIAFIAIALALARRRWLGRVRGTQ